MGYGRFHWMPASVRQVAELAKAQHGRHLALLHDVEATGQPAQTGHHHGDTEALEQAATGWPARAATVGRAGLATAALAAGTDDFAAKRMDRNIQRALTGQRVEDMA